MNTNLSLKTKPSSLLSVYISIILLFEEKESLLKTIEDVNDDETVMQEWILEENARLKYEGQMSYAREEGLKEGIEQGIEQGIEKGIEYNVPISMDI